MKENKIHIAEELSGRTDDQVHICVYFQGAQDPLPLLTEYEWPLTLQILDCPSRSYTRDEFPRVDTPCPCGNRRHWLVVYDPTVLAI